MVYDYKQLFMIMDNFSVGKNVTVVISKISDPNAGSLIDEWSRDLMRRILRSLGSKTEPDDG